MKKLSPILIVIFLATITISCKKFDEKTQFNYTIEQDVTIPSTIGINLPFNTYTPDVKTNIDTELEIRNKKKKRIEHIYAKQLELFIKSPNNQTFNFLKDITISISADGLPKIKIAEAHNLTNKNTTYLTIPTQQNTDIQEYIKKDKITISTDVVTDETIFQDITITVKPTFFVDVKVLGI